MRDTKSYEYLNAVFLPPCLESPHPLWSCTVLKGLEKHLLEKVMLSGPRETCGGTGSQAFSSSRPWEAEWCDGHEPGGAALQGLACTSQSPEDIFFPTREFLYLGWRGGTEVWLGLLLHWPLWRLGGATLHAGCPEEPATETDAPECFLLLALSKTGMRKTTPLLKHTMHLSLGVLWALKEGCISPITSRRMMHPREPSVLWGRRGHSSLMPEPLSVGLYRLEVSADKGEDWKTLKPSLVCMCLFTKYSNQKWDLSTEAEKSLSEKPVYLGCRGYVDSNVPVLAQRTSGRNGVSELTPWMWLDMKLLHRSGDCLAFIHACIQEFVPPCSTCSNESKDPPHSVIGNVTQLITRGRERTLLPLVLDSSIPVCVSTERWPTGWRWSLVFHCPKR